MAKLQFFVAAGLLALGAGVTEPTWGRGFGGMHGGMRGGAMRLGGMPLGGMRGGMMGMRGMPRGVMRGGGFGGVGPRLGGAYPGGVRPGGGSFAGQRPGVGAFGGSNLAGLRPGGFSPEGSLGNQRRNLGSLSQSRLGSPGGLNAGRRDGGGLAGHGFPGGSAGGFRGSSGRLGTPGSLRIAGGPRDSGAGGFGGRPNQRQLGNFLGLPSDGGLHALGGNRLGRDQRGLVRQPAADLARHADLVRRGFRGRGFYSGDWYRRHPHAWYPGGWAYGTVWAAATWDSLDGWFDYVDTDPIYYDYGNNVTYQDDSVYMDGEDVATSDEYYAQAEDLASSGAQAQTTDDKKQWLPLGIFVMSHGQHTKGNLLLQLAVNKEGIMRGNFTDTITSDTKSVQGSVDKKTQRAAWTIGDNKKNVIETGIYNLTKDQAPCLVHFGKDRTEQWLLARLQQDDQRGAGGTHRPDRLLARSPCLHIECYATHLRSDFRRGQNHGTNRWQFNLTAKVPGDDGGWHGGNGGQSRRPHGQQDGSAGHRRDG